MIVILIFILIGCDLSPNLSPRELNCVDVYICLACQDGLHQFVELARLNALIGDGRYNVGRRDSSRDCARCSGRASWMTGATEEHLYPAVDIFLREMDMGCLSRARQTGERKGESYRARGLVKSRTKCALAGSGFGRDFVKPS